MQSKRSLAAGVIGAAVLSIVMASPLKAATITYVTPPGSTTGGGAVSASALFTTVAGAVNITLTNLQANITDVAQALSDLDFTFSNGITTGTLTSSSGQQVSIAANGTTSFGATTSTGWGLNNNVSGGLQLNALGFVGPAGLIVGPPGTGGVYTNANGSIAGNGPHNPFINQMATFTVSNAAITAATLITSAVFSFGTTAGIDVTGVPSTNPVPLPGALPLFATGLGGLLLMRWKRKRKAGPIAA
jgi:hypothetical protein